MPNRQCLNTKVLVDVQLIVHDRGHVEPLTPGTAVRAVYEASRMWSDMSCYDAFTTNYALRQNNFKCISGADAGIGTVMSHQRVVNTSQLASARLFHHNETLPTGELLYGAYAMGVDRDQWYCVLFDGDFFWARYDWIEVVCEAENSVVEQKV